MVKIKHMPTWESVAFINWLQMIGYKVLQRGMQIDLIPRYRCKLNPRGGQIYYNGQMNKTAKLLLKEFREHLAA